MSDSDLTLAVKALVGKRDTYTRLWQYYDGVQPLIYSSDRLKTVFSKINARFTQNWCGVVVDSVMERLSFKQFLVTGDERLTETLNGWWIDSEMHLDADDVELCAMVTGESFVIAQRTDDGVQSFYNDSRLVHVFYEADNPRQIRMAAKWFDNDAGGADLTLYYPDRLVYFRSDKALELIKTAADAKAFLPLPVEAGEGEAQNERSIEPGEIGIFHFRRERRAIRSELNQSVLDTQDAVNKLVADMMVSAEFGAFRQRYIISNAEIGEMENAPNMIWDIPAGDGLSQATEVGEFEQTDLGQFLNGIKDFSVAIGKMTRTPSSYFFLGARSDPSGEALIAMESPLNKKVSKYAERFAADWRRLGAFVADRPLSALQAIYEDPRTVQPFTQAQTRQTNLNAGIPLTTQLRREGWTVQELAQLQADKEAEAASAQQGMAVALLNAQRSMDQGDPTQNG